jgi:hypothetical protein
MAKKSTGQPTLTATRKNGTKEEKKGLRKPQIRVLQALSKSKSALSRTEIGKKAEVDVASLTEVIGSSDAETRKKNDTRKGWKSLLTLKYVTASDKDGTTTYSITAAGTKALAANK